MILRYTHGSVSSPTITTGFLQHLVRAMQKLRTKGGRGVAVRGFRTPGHQDNMANGIIGLTSPLKLQARVCMGLI